MQWHVIVPGTTGTAYTLPVSESAKKTEIKKKIKKKEKASCPPRGGRGGPSNCMLKIKHHYYGGP